MHEESIELDEGQSRSDSGYRGWETALHSLVDTVIVEKADARPDTGYRVSGRSPNWSAPPSARRISNANATRAVLLEISRPVFRFVAITCAFFLFQTLSLPSSFPHSSASLVSSFSFRYAHPRERKSRHSWHFRFLRLNRGLNFAREISLCGLLWWT